jgi:predicted nuclease of predicted toxin-antitoxin system
MRVRFQADADLNLDIVTGVIRREPQVDFQTAESVGLRRLSDPEVLAWAAEEQRILVTHDLRTMPRHFADFIQRRNSPGVLIIPQHVPVRAAIVELLLVCEASEQAEWTNRITLLPL